ncbi:hypothetical protein V5E97_11200 [Singulisphaera sp. Ch08]|uniref:Transposase n=1 Tax=Singulisphaera sp. Ch08 TaxID=3120278 RepID=A0AAU7CNI0_9BACT
MRPYSQDLRERILETVACGEGSLCQIAQRHSIIAYTIAHLLKQY